MPLHTGNIIADKSYDYANRIVKAYKFLKFKQKEYIMSKQLLRSGTAVRALVGEAEFAQSTNDFISKNSIALKEANESVYWLHLLHDNEYIDDSSFDSIIKDAKEIVAILVSIIKKSKEQKQTSSKERNLMKKEKSLN